MSDRSRAEPHERPLTRLHAWNHRVEVIVYRAPSRQIPQPGSLPHPPAQLPTGSVKQDKGRCSLDSSLLGVLLIHVGRHVQEQQAPGMPFVANTADGSNLLYSAEAEFRIELDEDRLAERSDGPVNGRDGW